MARISPADIRAMSPSVKVVVERHTRVAHQHVTNMKATLSHSLSAFEAYMHLYPLYDEVRKILGNKNAALLGWSVAKGGNCELYIAQFRKDLFDIGYNADNLFLAENEKDLTDFGFALSRHKGRVADHLYRAIASRQTTAAMVLILAFAGQVVAAGIFNCLAETELDDYLYEYKEPLRFV